MNRYPLFIAFLLSLTAFQVNAQRTVSGHVISKIGEPLPAAIQLTRTHKGTIAQADNGFFQLNIPSDSTTSLLISAVGYLKLIKHIPEGKEAVYLGKIELTEDAIGLEQVTVSATRNKIALNESPTLVQVVNKKVFEAVQATSLSQGLQFSPGLRVENNCQNCGFTSLRMNGLQGPYTQMLINSRPVFSALAGVYGLEQIPANMVERVEVVRGGGSVLYGGNAIAGTVNVITADPVENSAQLQHQYQLIGGSAPEHYSTGNTAWVHKNGKWGGQAFATYRNRSPWDANSDGFSEITKIEAKAGGAGLFYKPDKNHRFQMQAYGLQEFRRGGSDFDRVPHLAAIAEQLHHSVGGLQWSFEGYAQSRDLRWSVYQGLQAIDRQAYYGGLGRTWVPGEALTEEDLEAENAYGSTGDISLNTGLQLSKTWKRFTMTSGLEHTFNKVNDRFTGYGRSINQRVQILGAYAQLEWQPSAKWHLTVGNRFDQVFINGKYQLQNEPFGQNLYLPVWIPRITALHKVDEFTNLRISASKGYRAPQAFDEDLHITAVGGEARYIQLSPDLRPEHSLAYSASWDKTWYRSDWQFNVVAESFFNRLYNAFVLANPRPLPEGGSVITKVNSAGARVGGLNLEAKAAYGRKLIFQLGATIQQAQFIENQVIWESEENAEEAVSSKQMLRTPNTYGFVLMQWSPINRTTFFMTHTFTGSMLAARLVDVETERPELVSTPMFWDMTLKINREIPLNRRYLLNVFGGVNNLFNSFQKDFQTGPLRDAGYVYGPMLPRTLAFGVSMRYQ